MVGGMPGASRGHSSQAVSSLTCALDRGGFVIQIRKSTAGPWLTGSILPEDFRKSPWQHWVSASLSMGTDVISILDTDPRGFCLESPLWAKTLQVSQSFRPLED